MKKQTKCYIYTRVSTAIQVDGYSLDAQRDKLSKYAEYQDMEVVKEFSDAGHSGKNINGRRSNEKIQGTRNEYHVVKQEEYDLYDGIHEAIISEDDFRLAAKKRKETGVKREKTHRLKVDGHNCGYHHQWGQDKVNAAVEEVIYKLVNNPKFQDALKTKVGAKTDTEELEKERDICRTRLRQTIGAKNKLADQMDALDVCDKFYDRKYEDMQDRLNKLYEEIGAIEDEIDTISMRINNINKKQLSKDSIYRILKSFDKIYSEFTDAEKKRFINSFVESVEIFEEEQEDGRFLKSIKFRFPVYYNGAETQEVDLSDSGWDYQRSLETVALLSKLH